MTAPFHTVPQLPVQHKESKPWLLSQSYKSSAQQLSVQISPCTPDQSNSLEQGPPTGHPRGLGPTPCSAPGACCVDGRAAAESSHSFHGGRCGCSDLLLFPLRTLQSWTTHRLPPKGWEERWICSHKEIPQRAPVRDGLLSPCSPSPVIQTM